jgi:hypothetical protein
MKPVRPLLGLLCIVVLSQTVGLGADRPQSELENAALSYWQAFALMPEANEENDKIIRDWDTVELDKETLEVIKNGAPSMELLHRGASIQRCYWGSALEKGPAAMLPHLSKTRHLARLACLRARHRFEQGRPVQAWADLRDTLVLARHTGSEEVLISVLVQFAIEREAAEAVAPYLPEFEKKDLQTMVADIKALPPRGTISQGIGGERKWMLGWLREEIAAALKKEGDERTRFLLDLVGDNSSDAKARAEELMNKPPAELKEMLDEVDAYYDEMLQLLAQPSPGLGAALEKLEKRIETSPNAIARFMLPGVSSCMRAEQRAIVQMALLLAAVDVVGGGRAKLAGHADPAGDGPFQLRELPGGFELRSKLVHRDETVTLRIGRGED